MGLPTLNSVSPCDCCHKPNCRDCGEVETDLEEEEEEEGEEDDLPETD